MKFLIAKFLDNAKMLTSTNEREIEMGRFSKSNSYGHRIQYFSGLGGWYRLSWTIDRYYAGSRLRHPRTSSRDTDEEGAKRFAKKWCISMPEKKTND